MLNLAWRSMLGNAVITEENGAQRVMASDVEIILPFYPDVPCPLHPNEP